MATSWPRAFGKREKLIHLLLVFKRFTEVHWFHLIHFIGRIAKQSFLMELSDCLWFGNALVNRLHSIP